MRKNISVPILAACAIAATVALGTVTRADDWSFIARLSPSLSEIVPDDARVEKLAENFGFLEGPVWVKKGGYLLFSDIPANVIYKWSPDAGKATVFLAYSGFTGKDDSDAGMQLNNGHGMVTLLGSNAVTLDSQGRVVYCAHGDHQVVRLEPDGRRTVLASEFEGKRLNSPNDLVYKSDGALYFSDPSAGFRNGNDDPKKELPFTGLFLLKDGKLQVLNRDMRPNGLAFSPDEKYIYLVDGTGGKKALTRYEVKPDDTLANGQLFIDMTPDKAPGGPDGIKVDQKGNVYSTGPGGVWIIAPNGQHIGTILTSELPANLAFGDADGKTLYLTARTGLYRIRLKIPGIMPPGSN
ncbi:MAG TPA: SMP-30/gluconolactonase/LRE family protein [Bryobacteraceae bacterium]|nr:SMP-30/gluconolactonase/LRE family protein [Bryobacteraceae bacterium]